MVIALSSSVPLVTTRFSLASVMKGGYSGMSEALFGSIVHPAEGGGMVVVVGGGETETVLGLMDLNF